MYRSAALVVITAIVVIVVAPVGAPVSLSHVTSDSMEPAIDEDDGYVLVPAGTVSAGDVGTFWSPAKDAYVTHRLADRPAYAYFPFSGGPRHCIGMRFARLELVMALATMVGRGTLDVSLDGALTFTPSLSLRPETTLRATVSRR